MNRLQRSSINMIAGTVGYIVPMLVNFIATPFLLHALGEAAFGLQNLVGVVVGYLTVMEVGMDMPIIKYLAEDHARSDVEAENRLLNTTLQLYVVIGLIGMAIIMLGADLFARRVFAVPPELIGQAVSVFELAGIGFMASVLTLWGRAVMIGLQRLDISNSVTVFVSVGGVGLGLAAVYAGFGVVGYVFFRVVASLLAGAIYFTFSHRLVRSFRWHWRMDRITLRRVGSYVRYGVLNRAMGALGGGLDRTLIGAWLGMAAVTHYAVPLLISSSIGYLLNSMLQFIFPMASELHGTNRMDEFRTIYIQATRFVAAVATMLCVPLWVLADRFLAIWVGPEIAGQSSGVFRLLLGAAYVGTLSVVLVNQVMPATGRIREYTIYSFARVGLFSASCWFLIGPLGIAGAGLALLLASGVDVIFGTVSLQRYFDISPISIFREAYLRPLILGLALAALAIIGYPLATSWARLVVVGAVLELFYVVVGYWIGVFGGIEKRALIGLRGILMNAAQRSIRLLV